MSAMKPPPNSQIQILDSASATQLIRLYDNVYNPNSPQQFIAAQSMGAPAAGYVAPVAPSGDVQALSGTGALAAVNLTSALTTVATTGAATSTLAAGTQTGTIKTIRMITYVGDFVLTVTGTGVATVTLGAAGDFVALMWDGAGWVVTDSVGAVIT